MQISSNFDGGNIRVLSLDNMNDIRLEIRKDPDSDYGQWFYFRLIDAAGYPCKLRIMNAHEAFEIGGWHEYRACASYDRIHWFRIPTSFEDGILTMQLKPDFNSVYLAYFAPYSYEQHQDFIHAAQISDACVLESIGRTVEGRALDLLTIGEPGPQKRNIWIIARQHPGEPMASYFMEGFVERLLDEEDPVSRKLLQKAVFYAIPNMNVDGSVAGYLRVNAAGRNLNREWANPDPKKSPEVYHALKKMESTGVDLMLDIHGDEELPVVFVSSIEGIPGYTDRLRNLHQGFTRSWLAISPDFQDEHGYKKDGPGKANLAICSKQIAHRFDCLAWTIEMPFKDNQNLPIPLTGWSPERSGKLGASLLNVILDHVDHLR